MKTLLAFLALAAAGNALENPTITQFKANEVHVFRVGGPKAQIFHVSGEKGEQLTLRAEISTSGRNLQAPYQQCDAPEGTTCFRWGGLRDGFTLTITPKSKCSLITGVSNNEAGEVRTYIPYGSDQWYGGTERYQQDWPVQNMYVNEDEPYTTRSPNNQGVLEPYWFSSQGTSIYVPPNTTLFFNSNKDGSVGQLGLSSANRAPYKTRGPPILQVEICDFGDPVTAHYNAIDQYLGKPTSHPGKRMMTFPTYSTWAKYKSDINQEKVLNFTNQILDQNYLMGQIEIDDKWETCYGTLEIDTKRFPNITQLTDYIHSKGGRVTIWVHPFVNTDCEFYQQALSEGRLVRNTNGSAVSSWWNGQGGVVDVTNTTTKEWWVQRLKNLLQTTGLDGFKFDGGESGWLPQLPEIIGDPELYPDSYVRNYVEAAAEFGEDLEVRLGRLTQDVPLFVRMLDKDSKWGLDNGLESVLTTTFQMGLVGYPFILPDMIGGNAYGETPTKELYIRWVQASALLPAMQFSLLPWDYDQETTDICRRYLDLHTNYTQQLLDASDLTLSDGRPLITPLWWYAPNDSETYAIRNEYMTGDKILVAPVLEDGARQRDIYLPKGSWVDSRQQTFEGPTWVRDYSSPLDYLPVFTKV